MKLADVIKYSLRGISRRKGRLWLTVLGIIIGIASVVSLLMIGEGFSASINKELSSFNANTIYILPLAESAMQSSGFGGGALPPSAGKLTEKDVNALKKVPEIEELARLTERRASVEYKGKEITATVNGIEPGVFQRISFIEVAEGRFLLDTDRRAVGIGATMAEKGFGVDKPIRVNSYITINGAKYRVIGILKESGSSFGSDLDNGIFIHYEDSKDVFKDTLSKDEMDYIAVAVAEGSDMKSIVESIKAELDSERRVRAGERDYTVVDPEMITAAVGNVLSLLTLFLGAIASISLLVGGLAIATSMFTSVIERTKEIGIMKSVGANSGDILNIFLFESGTLGALGGIAGALLGVSFVYIGSAFGLPVSFNPYIALFGVAFAFIVGVLSGYFPARRAARLSPVDALRYE